MPTDSGSRRTDLGDHDELTQEADDAEDEQEPLPPAGPAQRRVELVGDRGDHNLNDDELLRDGIHR